MPSLDVVSEIAMHEVDNAVQQASKEVGQRFDFKGTDTAIEKTDEGIVLQANSEYRLQAAMDVLREKLAKRGVSLKVLDPQKPQPAAKSSFRQLVKLQQGISTEKAKQIVKLVKDSKLKVQAAIQGEQLRISGKKRDDLQAVMALLREKEAELAVPLQYTNFRD